MIVIHQRQQIMLAPAAVNSMLLGPTIYEQYHSVHGLSGQLHVRVLTYYEHQSSSLQLDVCYNLPGVALALAIGWDSPWLDVHDMHCQCIIQSA